MIHPDTENPFKSLFEIAVSIGNSLNINEMLKESLVVYMQKLGCDAALVYRYTSQGAGYEKVSELVFSLPYTMNIRSVFATIESSVGAACVKGFIDCNDMSPVCRAIEGDLHFCMFSLKDFGYMVLVKSGAMLNPDIVHQLTIVNEKLAQACRACVINEALETSEKRYRDLSELLPEMICEVDLSGNVTYANKYAIDKMGYSLADLRRGLNVFDFFAPPDLEKAHSNFALALETDNVPPRDYNVLRSDGIMIPVIIYTRRIEKNGLVQGLRGVMVDISYRIDNERRLQQYTERLELALLGSDAGLWDWNIVTGEVYFSERWCTMLGYEPHEVEPHVNFWEKILHPADTATVKECFTRHLDGKTPIYCTEHRVKTKQGTWKWILDTGRVTQRDSDGTPIRAVGTHIDISERKQLEEVEIMERNLGLCLSKATSLDETLDICLASATSVQGMDAGGIYIVDEDTKDICLARHAGFTDEFVQQKSHYAPGSAYARIIMAGVPVYSSHSHLVENNLLSPSSEPLKAVAVLPIMYFDNVVGCLNIASHTLDEIPEFTRSMLEKIAAYVGSFIVQARREDSIVRNRQDLDTLFNTIDDFLFILDEQGCIIHCNNAVTGRLGYQLGELVGQSVLLVHPQSRHAEALVKIEAMLRGDEKTYTIPLRRKDGSDIPVETKVIAGKWNGKTAIIGISRDTYERRTYEAQLKQNSERLEMALLASNAGMWDWNMKTGEVVVNKKWYDMRGLEANTDRVTLELLERTIHPDDKATVINELNLHLHGKTPYYQAEYRTSTSQGTYIWVFDTGKVTEFDEDGNAVRMVGTNIDINTKKENEFKLQQNLNQQELLSDIALELNLLDDFDKRINTVLSKIGSFTGVSRVYVFEDSDEGRTCSNTFEWCNAGITPQIDILQDIPYDEVIPSWKPILLNEGRVYSEDISQLPDDIIAVVEPQQIKSIVVYPLYVQGAFFGFIGFDECVRFKNWSKSELELLRTVSGIIANTYERKISELSLKDSEAKNRAMLESMPDILFHFNADGKILSYHSSSTDNLMVQPEQFINKYLHDIFPPAFASFVHDAIGQCFTRGFYQIEYEFPIRDKLMFFEARLSKMNDQEVIVIVRNVSERREHERQLKEERDRANEANRAKSEFLANMSHEIRTPMNAILGFSEALYHKLDSGQLQKMVKSILSSGNLLLSLLNDILDLSKIEAGKLEILPQPLDLLSIVDEIRLLFSDKAAKKGIDLDVRVGDAFPPVLLLDEIRIKQVVFNLVGNAIKFTHKGHVRICLSFVPLSGTSGNVQIDVSDTGIGIVKTQQEVIFEAFRQQSGQSNRNYEGVGLGLAIARRLVEKMSGSITVSSIVGEGSTFTVLIPGVEASVVEIRKREFYDDQQDVIFDNATILVVDDVSSNIEAVESLLASNGLSFIAAENGEMAVEILKHTCPDLILLDIRMPGIDGFEVARQVKENTHRKHIPVIAFTASVFSSERIESSTNFEGFVFKPVNKLELLTQFKRFLRFTVVTPPAPLVTAQLPVQVLPQAVNCLPQLFEQLNSTMRTRWETLKDSLVLFNIEAFANELAAVACEHSFDYLDEYAKKLLSDVDSVDLESIRDTLSQFPAIIDVVGRLRDNQQDSQPLQPIR